MCISKIVVPLGYCHITMPSSTNLWQLQGLILVLKCFSTVSKTLVPLALAELHHNNKNSSSSYDVVEENYSLSHENAFFVVLVASILYNWFNTKPPGKWLGLIATLLQVY